MHINKSILFSTVLSCIHKNYTGPDRNRIIELCRKVIYNDPTRSCVLKGKRGAWEGLPPHKSLFHSPENCGLPIGNLTSQVFANLYLNSFVHFIKHDLEIRYYGRYVDDFCIVHNDKAFLLSLIPKLRRFLETRLRLTLHPKKVYLQHYTKGVTFLGTVIKPSRIYIADRTKGNFYHAIEKQNEIVRDHPPVEEEKKAFLSSMNSYPGIMKHYHTHRLRRRMVLGQLSGWWWRYVYLSGGAAKFVLRRKEVRVHFG